MPDPDLFLRLTTPLNEALRQAETLDWVEIGRGMGIGFLVVIGILLWMAYQDWHQPPGGTA